MSDVLVLRLGILCLFAAVCVVTLVLAAASTKATGVARSLAAIDQLRQSRDVATQELPLADRLISPFIGRLRALALRLTPEDRARRLQRNLDLAGNPTGWDAERILGYKGLGLIGLGLLGALLGAKSLATLLLFTAVAGAFGFFLPDILVYNAGLHRQEKIQKTLPDALDMLTICVEAGLGFDAALAQVARNTDGPLAGEFFRVLQEIQIGKSRMQAFRALVDRTTVAELRNFVAALSQADSLGIPIANVLREQSGEMRLKRKQRAEEKAQKVPVKIVFPLILCIFPALFVIVIGPGAMSIMKAFSGN
jgi:tight adherence protein C